MKKMPNERALPKWMIDKAYANASDMLKNEEGIIEESPHDYQCFTFKDDGVCLIFYPHRTSARNYHIRVRDQGSKNKTRANDLMNMLDEGAGHNCTFTKKVSWN